MKFSGTDYELEKVPCQLDGLDTPSPSFFVRRTDTGQPLAVVGREYAIMQQQDCFEPLQEIASEIEIIKMGALGVGEKCFACAKLPESFTIGGDLIDLYFTIFITHNGSGSNKWFITPNRFVCQNCVNLNYRNAIRAMSVSHHAKWEDKVKDVRRNLGLVHDYYAGFKATAEEMLAQKFDEEEFFTLMSKLWPAPEQDASKTAWTFYETRRETVLESYYAADLENIRYTKWGAYNAIADYADHSRLYKGEKKAETAFLNTFMNTTIKDRTFELLTI